MTVANPFIEIYNSFNNFISNNIIDINATRLAKTTRQQRNWVFPEYPRNNDEYYPRLCFQFDNPRFLDTGASNFNHEIYNDDDDLEKEQYLIILETNFVITLFVKKEQAHSVSYPDGTTHTLKNTAQCDFLAANIAQKIQFNKDKFISDGIEIGNEIYITRTYEDNEFLFAARITIPIKKYCVQEVFYAPADIIATIIETTEAERYEE